jgi:hypothetical protein
MNKSFTRKLLAACIFGCMATIAIADGTPVKLHIDAANSNGGLALLSESGWPLTIKMVVDFPEGEAFPAYAIQPNYATRGNWGFIIFDDGPNGCLNPPIPDWLVLTTTECWWPDFIPVTDPPWDPLTDWVKPESDEVYMEFWPDVDMAGVEDHTGNAVRQADLLDSAGSRGPDFQKWNADTCVPGTDDVDCIRFGPNTGGEITDGFGFGADDDITGLVIIAEYGVGRVFDEPDFELSDPIGAVNLAGLVNSVSYDLSDLNKENIKAKGAKGKPTEIITEQTKIWAHMNMEPGVLRHLIQYDACTGVVTSPDGDSGICEGNDLWRVDGGPVEQPPFKFERDDAASIYLLESTTYTLKVFLVAGQAPNRLFDEDGDGDVDSADAVEAGYTLLSNEDSISLLQLSQELCWGGGGGSYEWDLDDNGVLRTPIVCPASAGTISRPPR